MLGLGLATSYAPAMYRDPGEWPKLHEWLTGDAPQPHELADESPEALQQQQGRIKSGFAALRDQLAEYKPDVLVVLASDSGRLFSPVQVPQFWTYLGEEIWGSTRRPEMGEKAEDEILRARCASDLAAFIQQELVDHAFDMNYGKLLNPMGQPEYGAPISLMEPIRALTPDMDIPVVPILVNCMVPPAPSGHRCYDFGVALAEILDEPTERIALVASGGLSHDHHGPRAGWVDVPLDRWVLEKLTRGKGSVLKPMFDLESDTLQGGTAEVRLWAIVAGACEALGAKATLVDYFPSYTAATGICFAHWTASR